MRLRTKYTQRLPTACGLVLDIPLFEGSGLIAHDISGKGNHGTLTGCTWTSCSKGRSLSFDGNTDNVDCGNGESLSMADSLTLEAWAKRSVEDAWQRLIVKAQENSPYPGYMMDFSVSNKGSGLVANTEEGPRAYTADSITLNTLYHLSITQDNVNIQMYLNGVVNGDSVADAVTAATVEETLKLGRWQTVSGYTGSMSIVRVYKQAVDSLNIKRRYEQPDRDYCRGS